jgi:hypothetical protein
VIKISNNGKRCIVHRAKLAHAHDPANSGLWRLVSRKQRSSPAGLAGPYQRQGVPPTLGVAAVTGRPTNEVRRGGRNEHQGTSASLQDMARETGADHFGAAMMRRRVAPGSTTYRGGGGLRWMGATPSRAYGSWGRRIA